MKIRGKKLNMVDRRIKGESRKHYLNYLKKEYKEHFPFEGNRLEKIIYNFNMERAVAKMEEKSYDYYFMEDGFNFERPSILDTLKFAFNIDNKKKSKAKEKDEEEIIEEDIIEEEKEEEKEPKFSKVKNFFSNLKNKIVDKYNNFVTNKLNTKEDDNEEFEEEYLEENLPEYDADEIIEEEYLEENLPENNELSLEEQYKLNLLKLKKQLNDHIAECKKSMEVYDRKLMICKENLEKLKNKSVKVQRNNNINANCIIIKNADLEQQRKNKIAKYNELYEMYLNNCTNPYNNDLTVNEIEKAKVKVKTR